MRVVETVQEMRGTRALLESPVSMVATLGGMHCGHEALLEHARKLGRSLVASLFLNPTQFGDSADFDRYPRDTECDLAIFGAHGVDVVFKPSVEEMYPSGSVTKVDPGPLGSVLEGEHRPGHFQTVATVVTKILTVIRPDIAVWGAKDAQQNVIIRQLSRDLLMEIDHEIVPTVRAEDGLALSSRNEYLSAEERKAATVVYAALAEARKLWQRGEHDAAVLRGIVRVIVEKEPRADLKYVSIADPNTLDELVEAGPGALISLAAVIGDARLIDNVTLELE